MNSSGVAPAEGRALYHRHPEFTGSLLNLWVAYVRGALRASDGAVLLDGEKMRVNWLLWREQEARQCVKNFAQWLGPGRKELRVSVRFLLAPVLAARRRKHWPAAGASWESIRKYAERRGRDERSSPERDERGYRGILFCFRQDEDRRMVQPLSGLGLR